MQRPTRLTALVALLVCDAFGQTSTVMHGRVIDRESGGPVGGAQVSIAMSGQQTTTDAAGQFSIRGVPSGAIEVQTGGAGFAPTLRRVELPAGADTEVTFELERASLATPVDTHGGAALRGVELRVLSTALFNDPLRAVQSLPGVAAADDFYSEFAYRGAGVRGVGFYLDGAPIDQPFHSLQPIHDLGSTSLAGLDVIESVSLEASSAAKYGEAPKA